MTDEGAVMGVREGAPNGPDRAQIPWLCVLVFLTSAAMSSKVMSPIVPSRETDIMAIQVDCVEECHEL